ncbi:MULTISPECIES: hypothetical protein [Bacillaceae]|uniref:hypothetical protein n=1 Tax=Bacillaceae TaxID=186817 RepID=UPI0005A4A1D0|nr:hypothetical protein [Caldibacillus thermoamylovorans]KIO64279.1 hypothetical protein B4065_2747 [Caldibacillus thermoamylovorans]
MNNDVPVEKEKKVVDTKVVKINADLHYKLNLYKAKKGNSITITDLVNQAVTEYIKNHSEITEAIEE